MVTFSAVLKNCLIPKSLCTCQRRASVKDSKTGKRRLKCHLTIPQKAPARVIPASLTDSSQVLWEIVHWQACHVRCALTADKVETVTFPHMIWMGVFEGDVHKEGLCVRANQVTGLHELTRLWGMEHGTLSLAPAQTSKWWSSCWEPNMHNHQEVCSHFCWSVWQLWACQNLILIFCYRNMAG